MSKGWYVKVATQIVVDIDTNIGVVASTEEKAGIVAQEIVSNNLDKSDYVAELDRMISWDFRIGGMEWNRSGHPDIDFDTMQCLFIEPDPDFDPEPDNEEPRSECCGAELLHYNNEIGLCAECKEWSGPHEEDDEDQGPSTDVLSLLQAAQCLNEAYHNLPEDHPLKHWQIIYGIAEVREQLSKIAVYCDMTHRVMYEEQGYDGCFDFDFVPQFLENCVADDFELKSTNPHVLSMYWRAF